MTGRLRFLFAFSLLVFSLFCSPFAAAMQYYIGEGGVYYTSPDAACRSRAGEYMAFQSFEWLPSAGPVCVYKNTVTESVSRVALSVNYETYALAEPLEDFAPEQCVGNPIDPVTGNKFQREPLVRLEGPVPLSFDLYYNSHRNEKWRHDFARSVSLLSEQQLPRYQFGDRKLCPGEGRLESPGGIMGGYGAASGGSGSIYAAQYNADTEDRIQAYSTREDACRYGWSRRRGRYHASWIAGSYAEYAGGSDCAVFDAEGRRRMTLSVYGLIGGARMVSEANVDICALADLGRPPLLDGSEAVYLRFVRQDGRVRTFRYEAASGEWSNRNHSGERAELVYEGGTLAGYRFYSAADEVEDYDAAGRLTSIRALNGFVTTLSYDDDSGLLARVENPTGAALDFTYVSDGDSGPLRLDQVRDHSGRSWAFHYHAVSGLLSAVEFPDATTRRYHYEDTARPGLLTGLTDRRGIRYAHWSYNPAGKAILSAHGPDAAIDRVEIEYQAGGARTVTTQRTSSLDSNTTVLESTYTADTVNGHKQVTRIQGPSCYGGAGDVQSEQDPETGYVRWEARQGRRTEYGDYDERGHPGYVLEAAGTAEARRTDYTYDPRFHGKVATVTEPSVYAGRHKITTYSYDEYGNPTAVRIDGYTPDGAAVQRAVSLQYQGPYRQLSQIDGPRSDVDDIVSFDYYPDDAGEANHRARLRTVTGPGGMALRSHITYTATGKIASEDRPNHLHIDYTYEEGSDRLQDLIQTDTAGGASVTTRWTYLASGPIATVTRAHGRPDAVTLTLGYDDAQRLTRITDNLGNVLEYRLDSEGNVEQENIYDTEGILRKTLTQTFDPYNRPDSFSDANATGDWDFNADGRPGRFTDGHGIVRQYEYDALRRLSRITDDPGGDNPATADTQSRYDYDIHGRLTSVTDANGNETRHVYDDLGNLLQSTSPDTGATVYSHDEAGNVITKTDAEGRVRRYRHDAWNRLIALEYPADPRQNIAYRYDETDVAHGQGRLTAITDATGVTRYHYDPHGNLTQTITTLNGQTYTTRYAYDPLHRLSRITYPSGRIVDYRDTNHDRRTDRITLDDQGSVTVLADTLQYLPHGPRTGLSFGNGRTETRQYGTDYRLESHSLPTADLETDTDEDGIADTLDNCSQVANPDQRDTDRDGYGNLCDPDYNNDGAINFIDLGLLKAVFFENDENIDLNGDGSVNFIDLGIIKSMFYQVPGPSCCGQNPIVINDETRHHGYDNNGHLSHRGADPENPSHRYDYDEFNRLIAETNPQYSDQYAYDRNGNRTAHTRDSNPSPNQIDPASNRLQQTGAETRSHDATGNTTRDRNGTRVFTYHPNGRLAEVHENNQLLARYTYNGQGQRSIKTTPEHTTHYLYDLDGRLLGEYNANGQAIKEYVRIENEPLAQIETDTILYLHTDHLGTPRSATDPTGQVVWQWNSDAFGNTAPQSGDGSTINLRFPGQYFDQETGLHYNYFRYYDPSTGRYISSDPIGLAGGLNTYAYVLNNPLYWIDPYGLESVPGAVPGVPGLPIVVPPVAVPGSPENQGWVEMANDVISYTSDIINNAGNALLCAKYGMCDEVADAEREKSRNKGVPECDIGPSGKPKIHNPKHSSKKKAREAAQHDGKGPPMHHPSPTVGGPHYHPTDSDGNKIPGTHHNY